MSRACGGACGSLCPEASTSPGRAPVSAPRAQRQAWVCLAFPMAPGVESLLRPPGPRGFSSLGSGGRSGLSSLRPAFPVGRCLLLEQPRRGLRVVLLLLGYEGRVVAAAKTE